MLLTRCSDAVTKFQGKFSKFPASPNSQDNLICCADMYLVRFLANFAGFRLFLWISRDFADLLEIRGSATTRNIRSPVAGTHLTLRVSIWIICVVVFLPPQKSTLLNSTSIWKQWKKNTSLRDALQQLLGFPIFFPPQKQASPNSNLNRIEDLYKNQLRLTWLSLLKIYC